MQAWISPLSTRNCRKMAGFLELAGRCGMLRANRTPGQGYALVMDGTWTDKHMSVLYDAGFDAFFYPDEMDELKKWIANL